MTNLCLSVVIYVAK